MENHLATNDSRESTRSKTYSFLTKYAQPSHRVFGENITNTTNSGVHPGKPPSGPNFVEDVFKTPLAPASAHQTVNDPASSGKLLAKQLGEVAKTLATPVERKANEGRRCSILSDDLELQTSILDLNGFDAQGDRRRHSLSTPLIVNGRERVSNTRPGPALPARVDANVTSTASAEVAELRSQRDEMMSILEGYQGTIAKMSDEYSRDACAWTSENKLLKTEVERLRRERQQIHEQFTVLYEQKYVPLKEHAKRLEREADNSMQSKNMVAELDSLRKELDVMRGRWELSQAQVAEKQQEIEKLTERLRESSLLMEKISELTTRR